MGNPMKINRVFGTTTAELERLQQTVNFYDVYLDAVMKIIPVVTDEEAIQLNTAIEAVQDFREFVRGYFEANGVKLLSNNKEKNYVENK